MTIYTTEQIWAASNRRCVQYHAWSIGPRLVECWHYEVDEDVGRRLVDEGRAQLLDVPPGVLCLNGRE